MNTLKVTEIKRELNHHSHQQLVELCLHLAKFKKENKELLTYLLIDSEDEQAYIDSIKEEMDMAFSELNTARLYFVKKGCRKILRTTKKYIRYSKKKETEADVLLYFCLKLKSLSPSHLRSQQMMNMYSQQLKMAKKAISTLHEDLQYDFEELLTEVEG